MEEGRFEVELTPVAEHRSRRQRRSTAPAAGVSPTGTSPIGPVEPPAAPDADDVVTTGASIDATDGTGAGWLGSERSRVVTVAAVAAVVALLLGWMLGRAGRSDPATTEAATATTLVAEDEATDGASGSTLLEGEAIPPVRTTVPRRTTTTTILEVQTGTIAVDERLAEVPVELVGWALHWVVEADLRAGTTRTIQTDLRGGPHLLHVGPDWALVSRFDGPASRLVHADGTVERTSLGEPWSTLRIPGTDRFWRVAGDWWPGPARFTEIALDGSATGAELEVPRGVSGWHADPAGGILTTVAGGVYAVDPEGAVLVGRGDLVAAGATTAVLRTCDEGLACGYLVVDRATGSARSLRPVDDAGEAVELESTQFLGPSSLVPVSQDGRWATVLLVDGSFPRIGLLDLESGLVTDLARHDYGPVGVAAYFSADGRYLFHLRSDTPYVLDLETGDHFPVFAEPVSWSAFGVRDGTTARSSTPSGDNPGGSVQG